jgi:hypothetical protein
LSINRKKMVKKEQRYKWYQYKIFVAILLIVMLISCILLLELFTIFMHVFDLKHSSILVKDAFSLYVPVNISNIYIPDDVAVYYTKDLQCFTLDNFILLQESCLGYISIHSKDIFIDNSLSADEKKCILIHELAHYDWKYTLTKEDKKLIKSNYNIECSNSTSYECKSVDEFYAYGEERWCKWTMFKKLNQSMM